jgi:hypothetical protein
MASRLGAHPFSSPVGTVGTFPRVKRPGRGAWNWPLPHTPLWHSGYLVKHRDNFFLVRWHWVHLVLRPWFGLLYRPQMIDDDANDYGAIGGMRIGKGNQSIRRKPAPVPLSLPQMPHDLTRPQTRAAVVGSRRWLTAWAMARLQGQLYFLCWFVVVWIEFWSWIEFWAHGGYLLRFRIV